MALSNRFSSAALDENVARRIYNRTRLADCVRGTTNKVPIRPSSDAKEPSLLFRPETCSELEELPQGETDRLTFQGYRTRHAISAPALDLSPTMFL